MQTPFEASVILAVIVVLTVVLPTCRILNFTVDKEYRNNGFGKKMIRQYLNIIPVNSILFLEVNKNNYVARKIYTDFNFKEIYQRKNYYKNGEDALILKYEKNSNK